MSLRSENIGRIDFRFDKNFRYESGDRVSCFDEKIKGKKSHVSLPLKGQSHEIFHLNFSSWNTSA
jgi:hypothetical protein